MTPPDFVGNLGVTIMTKYLVTVTTTAILFVSQSVFASSCESLIKDLNQMQEAQSVLLQTFVDKNETVAKGFDSQAKKFSEKYQLDSAIEDSDFLGLRQAAEGFRLHKKREQLLVNKFQDKSNDILMRVKECLKSSSRVAVPKQASR